jgi:cytochrome bd ubiquinol oxidase subunit II
LSLRTKGEILERAQRAAERLWLPAVVLVAIFVVGGYIATDMFSRLGLNPGPVPLGAGAALLAAGWFIRQRLPRLGLCHDLPDHRRSPLPASPWVSTPA